MVRSIKRNPPRELVNRDSVSVGCLLLQLGLKAVRIRKGPILGKVLPVIPARLL